LVCVRGFGEPCGRAMARDLLYAAAGKAVWGGGRRAARTRAALHQRTLPESPACEASAAPPSSGAEHRRGL